MLMLLAQAATTANPTTAGAPAPAWFGLLASWGPIILILIFFFVFTSGAKRKQERERRELLDNLKRGDKIRLIGGEYGAVVDTRDNKVLVKVDEGSNTKIWYARDAVQAVEKDEPAAK